jgi:Ni/Fe-hydrogenase subunit HybB-like protein
VTAFSLDRCSAAFGRTVARLAAAGAALGLLAFATGLLLGRSGIALAALDASFLFFAGLSAGGVALAAATRVTYGRWARPLLPIADASAGFFAPALAVLLVLLLGARTFIPWTGTAGAGHLAALYLRQLVASAALFAAGSAFVRRARSTGADEGRVRSAGVVYLACYAVVLSFWAFDLVMELSDSPPSTVIPAYYFLGAFLSGLAWVALVAALRGTSGPDLRHDVGKLLFAFIVVWSYLLWSLFLPTWYANIPEESALLLRRWHGGYKPVAAFVLVAVFAWPFWLLFNERLKRRRATLAVGAATILVGLLAERFLMVLPSLQLTAGAATWLVGGGVALGVAGLFLLSVGSRLAAIEAGDAPAG